MPLYNPPTGAADGVNIVAAGTQTANTTGTVLFQNSNGLTFGMSNSSVVTGSYTVPTVPAQASFGNSNLGNTAGDTGVVTGRLVLVGTNNITLSGSTNAGSMTISISGGAGAAGNTGSLSAGTTRATLGEVVFSDSNGLSFGANGQTITGSHNGLTSQSNQNVTAGNGGFAFQTLSFSNANGMSFGTSAGSAITGSYTVPTVPAQGSFGFSTNGNTAGDTGLVTGRLVLIGGNNVTLSGSTNAGSISVTVSGPNTVAQSAQTLGLYATSNTTQSSSGTQDARSLTFAGAGIASVGVTNGSVVISVPSGGGAGDGGVFAGVSTGGNTAGSTGTVSTGNFILVGSNGISLSQSTGAVGSAATVTIDGDAPQSVWRPSFARDVASAGTAQANSLVSIAPYIMDARVAASQIRVAMSISAATAANNSSAYLDVSISGVWYTRNGSTLSSIFSHSGSYTQFATSNATGTLTGINAFSMSFPATTLSRGEYFLALHVSTTNTGTGANTTALGRSLFMMRAAGFVSQNVLYKNWGGNTNASQALLGGVGLISTGATRASIAFTDYTMTGTRFEQGVPAFVELRNVSWQ